MEMTISSVLVTGAGGVSGSLVMAELAERDIPVRALVRDPVKAKALKAYPNVTPFLADMLEPASMRAALDGVDRALLISTATDRLVETQQSFIDAAKAAGVRHIIKYSGMDAGIGFQPQNFRATRWHCEVEDYLVGSGLAWTILRPSQFMQFYLPGTVTGVSLQRNALVLPIGDGRLAPVDIADVAKVCAELLVEPGHERRIYEMSGPDAFAMPEACEIISQATGRKIEYVNVSYEEYANLLRAGGVPEPGVELLLELSRERAKCIESNIWLTTHRRFGVRPTNFAEFIHKNSASFSYASTV
jgi:uncharacterized protein YbjT (DUF2867 family)